MRAGVVGRLSVSSPLCARRIARTPLVRVRARIYVRESCQCARAYFWDKELCKHEFTSGGHYCPGPVASYPSGTSLVQSFLLVTLPVTSTSMRYDRYDTCLYVRARPSSTTCKCFANSDGPSGWHTLRFRRRGASRRHPRGNYFSPRASRRAKLHVYELSTHKRSR